MTETFTPSELATIRADLAECEREAAINAAAKKVADAAVEMQNAGNHLHLRIAAAAKLDLSVREYRALTEPPRPASNQSAIDRALERLTDEGKLEEMAENCK